MQNIREIPDAAFLPDIAPPENGTKLSTGWMYNAYTRSVEIACSSSIHHAIGRNDKTTSQKPRHLYSSKHGALMAMYNVLEKHFSKELQDIKCLIEKELTNET